MKKILTPEFKAEALELLKTQTIKQVAKSLNVSIATITRIKERKSKAIRSSDLVGLKNDILLGNFTAKELASKYNVSSVAIYYHCKKQRVVLKRNKLEKLLEKKRIFNDKIDKKILDLK